MRGAPRSGEHFPFDFRFGWHFQLFILHEVIQGYAKQDQNIEKVKKRESSIILSDWISYILRSVSATQSLRRGAMTRISRSRKPASKSGASSGKDGDSGNETAPPASSPRKPIARSAVVLPLTPHTQVECKWSSNGDKYFLARIVDHRQVKGAEGVWEHYVHYRGFNRRVDEWVSQDKLNLDTVIPPAVVDPSEGASKKRRVEEIHSEEEGEGHSDMEGDLHEHEQITKVKNVGKIELGRYEMDTWYWSPLPAEYHGVEKLYFCEYDLAFFKEREAMLRHLRKVRLLHPPGQEIYRHNGISMFEVDGAVAKTYCENLCYLAKLFLDHKCLDNDTDAFLFYVLCECDERGAHPVGYFSKVRVHGVHGVHGWALFYE